MQTTFSEEFSEFKAKVHSFVASTHFNAQLDEYKSILNKIVSVDPAEMKEQIQNSSEFIEARNQSLALMEKIVSLYKELDTIFQMDEESLGSFCQFDLRIVDERVARDLKEASGLLQEFENVSLRGKKILESLEDPFLSQGS